MKRIITACLALLDPRGILATALLLTVSFVLAIPVATLCQPATPPLPPGLFVSFDLPRTNSIAPGIVVSKPAHTPAFTVTCPHCKTLLGNCHPLAVQTNGWHSTPGGQVAERTVHFVCHNGSCRQQFTARNEKFVADVIAVEESE